MLFSSSASTEEDNPFFNLTVPNVAIDYELRSEPIPVGDPGVCVEGGDLAPELGARFGDSSAGGYVREVGDDRLILDLTLETEGDVDEVDAIITVGGGPLDGTIFRTSLGRFDSQTEWRDIPTLAKDGLSEATTLNIVFCLRKGVPLPITNVGFFDRQALDIEFSDEGIDGLAITGHARLAPSLADQQFRGSQPFTIALNDGDSLPLQALLSFPELEPFDSAIFYWKASPQLLQPLVELIEARHVGDDRNLVTIAITSPVHLNKPILKFPPVDVPLTIHLRPYETAYFRIDGVPDAFAEPATLSLEGGGSVDARGPLDHLNLKPVWIWEDGGDFDLSVEACNPLPQAVALDNPLDIPITVNGELAAIFSGLLVGEAPGGRCTNFEFADTFIDYFNGHEQAEFAFPPRGTFTDEEILDVILDLLIGPETRAEVGSPYLR